MVATGGKGGGTGGGGQSEGGGGQAEGGGGGQQGGAGGGPECEQPTQCPGVDTECRSRTCDGGVCVTSRTSLQASR